MRAHGNINADSREYKCGLTALYGTPAAKKKCDCMFAYLIIVASLIKVADGSSLYPVICIYIYSEKVK